MKTVAILQSCYIPWKGYFDIANSVDEFILYDECQYTRQDWRNRNRIKTPAGTSWLTIPVRVNGLYDQRLDETEVADPRWAHRHWRTLQQAYRKAPHFGHYADFIEDAYERCSSIQRLSVINRSLLLVVGELLGIETTISWSTDYSGSGGRTERIVSLCRQAEATTYLSGPRARSYIDESLFHEAGIELRYFNYDGYPEYRQLHPPFDHAVSILDLVFNTGPEAPRFMKSFDTGGAL